MQVTVNRKDTYFLTDSSRVIARFLYTSHERSKDIIHNVLAMSEEQTQSALNQVLRGYAKRHRNISMIFDKHFNKLQHLLDEIEINPDNLNQMQKALIGSYFTMEYSIESAAIFNPSIVEDPYQEELGPGEKRVVLVSEQLAKGIFHPLFLDLQ